MRKRDRRRGYRTETKATGIDYEAAGIQHPAEAFEMMRRGDIPPAPGGSGRRAGFALLLATLLVSAPTPPAQGGGATQGAFPDLPWGAESAVLGAGATASVSDPTAAFTNPARMLAIDERTFVAGTGDLYGLGLIHHSFASLTFPRRARDVDFDGTGQVVVRPADVTRAMGLSADILSLDAAGDTYRETRLAFSYAFRALGSSAAGFTIRYLSVSGDIDTLGASGYDLDLGLDVPLTDRLRAGVILRHGLSNISWDGGGDERLNVRLVGGIVVQYRPQVSFPLGIVWDPEGVGIQEVSAGAILHPRGDPLRLLAGLRYRPGDNQEILISGGASFFWKRLSAGYGFTADEAGLGSTHRFNFGIQF
jgi:hypothetical protein